jgi:hypothetical protein
MARNILFLGASYGSLLATKLLMAGHNVTLVCWKKTAEEIRSDSYCSIWAIEHGLDLGSPALQISRLLPSKDSQLLAECPIHVINDLDDVGLAPGSIKLIQCISDVVETHAFSKRLKGVPDEIQRDWSRVKEQIKVHVPSPPRFEKLKDWKPQTWSLRLRSGHRVHLEAPDRGAVAWRAVAIGSHKELGHG